MCIRNYLRRFIFQNNNIMILKFLFDRVVAFINGVSEEIFKVGFCLPAGPYVTDDDVRHIVDCIKEAVEC